MNDVWNLDPIYKGFDDPAFAADMAAMGETAKELENFAAQLQEVEPLDGLRKGIALQERFSDLINKLAGYASLRQSANTRDPDAGSRMGQIMAVYSTVAAPMAAYQEWASKLPNLMELVEQDDFLNGVAELETLYTPEELLDFLHILPVQFLCLQSPKFPKTLIITKATISLLITTDYEGLLFIPQRFFRRRN